MKTEAGYQPRNTPAERRAFFDAERRFDELVARITAAEATLADHETRITALEPP